ncbi:hypothetical protein JW877_06660 [bacterium]|nr:hypothetical protein [bacterium]
MKKLALLVMLLSLFTTLAYPEIDSLPRLPQTNVEIPWTELRQLIELSMRIDTTLLRPPVDYLLPSGQYDAEIKGESIIGQARFSIIVLKAGYVEIPLFDLSLPLQDPLLNGTPAPITPRNHKHTILIQGPGEFKFTTGFAMELPEQVANFRLNVPQSSSTLFQLSLPGTDKDVRISPGGRVFRRTSGGNTVIEAFLASTDYIFCEWMTAIPEEQEADVEPMLYGETHSLFSVGEGMVKGSVELNYSIVQGKVDVLRFEVPQEIRILSISSANLRDWKMEEGDGVRLINAYLKFPTGGSVNVHAELELTMEAVTAAVNLPVIRCLNVEREKGYVGVEATTNVEISLLEESLRTATRVDRSELPQALWGRAAFPIILAFKYLETPYIIPIGVEKHEDLPVKVATADNASFIALLTTDGNYIVKGTYSVRNNLKQFLALLLPREAELWSLFVNGKPAKPGKGTFDQILIPMEKSRGGGESTTFPVEIIYFVRGSKLRSFGSRKVVLPKVDVPVSVINLSLYLPHGFSYTGFGGNMQEAFFGVVYDEAGRALGGMDMESNIPAMAQKSAPMKEMLEAQVAMEEEVRDYAQSFTSTDKGVFPVRISIPEVGTLHRFQKYVVPEDSRAPYPEVRVRYSQKGIKAVLTAIVVILALMGFLYFAKAIMRFINRFKLIQKKIVGQLLKILIFGFIELLLLYWVASLFSVEGLAISLVWILGAITLIIFLLIRLLLKKLARSTGDETPSDE